MPCSIKRPPLLRPLLVNTPSANTPQRYHLPIHTRYSLKESIFGAFSKLLFSFLFSLFCFDLWCFSRFSLFYSSLPFCYLVLSCFSRLSLLFTALSSLWSFTFFFSSSFVLRPLPIQPEFCPCFLAGSPSPACYLSCLPSSLNAPLL